MTTTAKYTRRQFAADLMDMAADGRLTLTPEQMDCLIKWAASLDKKATTPTVNKKAIENERLAHDLVALMVSHADQPINARFIADHLAGVTTPQKATAVARAAKALGLIDTYTDKGRTYYRLIN